MDAFGSVMRGYQAGQQNQLARLSSQAYSVPEEARQPLLGKIAAISPQAAQAQQGQFEQQEDRTASQLQGLIGYVNRARSTGNPQAVNAALRAAGPFISKLTGREAPKEWTPDMDAGWAQLEAQVAMRNPNNATGAPTGFREIDMKLQAAGFQPGTPEYQEGMRIATGQQGRAATGGFGFEQVRGPDGMMRVQRTNPRTGVVEIYDESTGDFTPVGGGAPLNGGAPQVAPQMQPLPPGVQVEAGLSPEQMEAVRMDIANGGQSDQYTLPPRPAGNQFQNTQRVANRLAVGRSPEQDAAAIEQAKQNVQLGALPVELGMRTNAAVDQAVRIDEGKNAAEKAAAAPATIATLQNSLDSIDALLTSPELGSIVGLGSINPLNRIPGTEARGLIARADQIAGQAFLAAFNQLKGGGAITEREGAAATAAMARLDRSQSEADYRSALQDLKSAISPAIQRARDQQMRRPAPSQGTPSAPAGWSIQRVE